MKDLYLKYKFTDRGGAKVYDAYAADDRLELKKPLFEVRLKEDGKSTVCGDGTG